MKISLYILLCSELLISCSLFPDFERDIVNLNMRGKIDSVYIDYNNHSARMLNIISNSKLIYFEPLHQYGGTPLFEYVEKGDSIIKKKGSDVFIIKRNNKIKKFKFKNED